MDNIFKKTDKPLKSNQLIKAIEQVKEKKCEICGNTEWMGQPIKLEVHHIDGDRTNNTLENLQWLCKNCHAYTNNYGSKNIKDKKVVSDEAYIEALKNNSSVRQALFSLHLGDAGANYRRARYIIEKYNVVVGEKCEQKIIQENYCKKCGKIIAKESIYCFDCYKIVQRHVERPSRDILKEKIRNFPFTTIASEYGVSDNAIRKWCKAENLPYKKTEIKKYTDEQWLFI